MIKSHPLNTDRQTDSQPCSILQSWMQSRLSELTTKQTYSLTGSQERKRIDLVSVLQYLLLSRHHRHCQRIWEEEEEEEAAAESKLLLLYNATSGYLGDQDHQAPSGGTGFLRGGRERRTRGNHLLHCCGGRRASKRAKESAVAIRFVAGWLGIEGFLTLVLRQLSYNGDLENLHFLSQYLSAQRLSPFFRGAFLRLPRLPPYRRTRIHRRVLEISALGMRERDFRGLPMLSCGEVRDAWILLLLQGASTWMLLLGLTLGLVPGTLSCPHRCWGELCFFLFFFSFWNSSVLTGKFTILETTREWRDAGQMRSVLLEELESADDRRRIAWCLARWCRDRKPIWNGFVVAAETALRRWEKKLVATLICEPFFFRISSC